MKYIYSVIIFPLTSLLFAVFPGGLKAQGIEINLKKCINNAFRTSPSVIKSQYSLDAQEGNIKTAYGNLIPKLSFNGNWTRSRTINNQGSYNVGGYYIDLGKRDTTTDNFSLSLRSDVVLFDGLKNYDNITLAKSEKISLQINLEKLKSDIALKILSDYITVLKNRQIVIINQANLEDSKAQLEKIKIFVEVGKRTLSDVYKQDVVVAQNELAVEQSINNLDKSIADLVYDSNLPQEKTYIVSGQEFVTDLTLAQLQLYIDGHSDIDKLVLAALKNRYDYKAYEQTLEINKQNLDIARSTLLFPTLSGFASYSLSASRIQNITDSKVLSFGLTLSYPIFQGFSLDNSKQLAEINVRSANEDLLALRNQIMLEIKKAVIDLKSLYKQIEITERNLKAAEQDKFLAEESYRIGMGILLDVQTAATKYNNALLDKNNLIYNFIFAQKQLEYYQGILKY